MLRFQELITWLRMVFTHLFSFHRVAMDITVFRYNYFINISIYFGGTNNTKLSKQIILHTFVISVDCKMCTKNQLW